ncbi:MAG: hypothetical protein M3O22_04230 [Pseudomonadota bacterium]|nr:hypothetical protein [Pseudomonadota bacterium]
MGALTAAVLALSATLPARADFSGALSGVFLLSPPSMPQQPDAPARADFDRYMALDVLGLPRPDPDRLVRDFPHMTAYINAWDHVLPDPLRQSMSPPGKFRALRDLGKTGHGNGRSTFYRLVDGRTACVISLDPDFSEMRSITAFNLGFDERYILAWPWPAAVEREATLQHELAHCFVMDAGLPGEVNAWTWAWQALEEGPHRTYARKNREFMTRAYAMKSVLGTVHSLRAGREPDATHAVALGLYHMKKTGRTCFSSSHADVRSFEEKLAAKLEKLLPEGDISPASLVAAAGVLRRNRILAGPDEREWLGQIIRAVRYMENQGVFIRGTVARGLDRKGALWRAAKNRMEQNTTALYLAGNPRLPGCIPVAASKMAP